MTTPSEAALGRRLRSLREGRGLSLRTVGDNAGVSESFVSQVERGLANPSVASLRRLAEAVGASMSDLFEEGPSKGRQIKKTERSRLLHPLRKWEDFLITPREAKRLQVILSIIEEGQGSGDPYAHDSDEECVLVLKGSLVFRVGDEEYVLEEGDSLFFESRLDHWNRNPGPGPAEVLWISTPPSY